MHITIFKTSVRKTVGEKIGNWGRLHKEVSWMRVISEQVLKVGLSLLGSRLKELSRQEIGCVKSEETQIRHIQVSQVA